MLNPWGLRHFSSVLKCWMWRNLKSAWSFCLVIELWNAGSKDSLESSNFTRRCLRVDYSGSVFLNTALSTHRIKTFISGLLNCIVKNLFAFIVLVHLISYILRESSTGSPFPVFGVLNFLSLVLKLLVSFCVLLFASVSLVLFSSMSVLPFATSCFAFISVKFILFISTSFQNFPATFHCEILKWIIFCLFSIFSLSFSWPCCAACGILAPQPGIEPVHLAMKAQSLNHWITRGVPHIFFL